MYYKKLLAAALTVSCIGGIVPANSVRQQALRSVTAAKHVIIKVNNYVSVMKIKIYLPAMLEFR